MKTNHKKMAAAGAITATILAGGATIAAASGSPSGNSGQGSAVTGTDTPGAEASESQEGPEGKENDKESDDPSYTGTVKASFGGTDTESEGTDGSTQEADEAATLAPLATATEAEARTAATDAVAGTAGTPTLDDENGYVVWSVEVTQPDGTVVDVKVDAGDGSVLVQETGEDGEAD